MVCLSILWSKQTITDRKKKLSPEMCLVGVVIWRREGEERIKYPAYFSHREQSRVLISLVMILTSAVLMIMKKFHFSYGVGQSE
jgi:hypothetical protein